MHTPPRSVDFAVTCVVLALLAGTVETLLRPVGVGDLLVRAAVYTGVGALCVLTFRGTRWARTLLVGGLASIGLASLVVEPLAALLSANEGLLRDVGIDDVALGSIRALHIGAVIAALAAFCRADARAYFRTPMPRPR